MHCSLCVHAYACGCMPVRVGVGRLRGEQVAAWGHVLTFFLCVSSPIGSSLLQGIAQNPSPLTPCVASPEPLHHEHVSPHPTPPSHPTRVANSSARVTSWLESPSHPCRPSSMHVGDKA